MFCGVLKELFLIYAFNQTIPHFIGKCKDKHDYLTDISVVFRYDNTSYKNGNSSEDLQVKCVITPIIFHRSNSSDNHIFRLQKFLVQIHFKQ